MSGDRRAPFGIGGIRVHSDKVAVQAYPILSREVGPIGESIHGICPLGPQRKSLAAIFIAELVPLSVIDILVDSDTMRVLALDLSFIKKVGHGESEINAVLIASFAYPAHGCHIVLV